MARVLNQRVTWRFAAPVVIDGALVLFAVIASTFVLIDPQWHQEWFLLKVALLAGVCHLCLYFADLYDARSSGNTRELIVRLMRSLGATALVLSVIYAAVPGLMIGRGVSALTVGLLLACVPVWRFAFDGVVDRLAPSERIVILGTKPAALNLARELGERQRDLGVEVVGFVETETARIRSFVPAPGILGRVNDIPGIVERYRVDRVVVSLEDARGKLPMTDLLNMKLRGVRFDHLATAYEEYTGRIAVENLRPSWFIFSEGFRKSRVLLSTKRLVDVGAATFGLFVAGPLMLLVAAAVKLTSPGPAVCHQTRSGQGGRLFTMHTFRTARVDAEQNTSSECGSANDLDTTWVGTFLRRTGLDELPQLWNILAGHMSLVGPRPEPPELARELTVRIPFYAQRQAVKPGLTGWAQVRYTHGASDEDAMERLQYDLFYIKNMSGILDLFILLSTVKTVLRREGAR